MILLIIIIKETDTDKIIFIGGGYIRKNNNRTYASFEVKSNLTPKEKSYIKGKVNNDVFHLNIDNGNDTKKLLKYI